VRRFTFATTAGVVQLWPSSGARHPARRHPFRPWPLARRHNDAHDARL